MSLETTEIKSRIKRLRREVLLKEFNQLSNTIIIDYRDIELPTFQNRYKLSFKNLIRILDQKELTNFQMAITNKKNTGSPFLDEFIEILRTQQDMLFNNKNLNSSEKTDDSFSSDFGLDSLSDNNEMSFSDSFEPEPIIKSEEEAPDFSSETDQEEPASEKQKTTENAYNDIIQPNSENDKIEEITKNKKASVKVIKVNLEELDEIEIKSGFLEKQLPFIAKLVRKFKN
jgi:hypothetical protein